ncbi:unnamed protein product [Lactuca virosa]|uniref:Uncharacterized protein n=1 Tax=Lactuca virosa TaxID=75947 RepID=A0AAU9M115_9ASTR|nr:unnamed protein product [Lactuca virosa]
MIINGIYLYLNSRDDQNKHGVVFNVYGHLFGLVSGSLFLSLDKLSNEKKHLNSGGKSSFFQDEASLINHLQSPTITTLNSFPYGDLNLVIPQKNNPTRLITTIESHRKSNFIVGVTPMDGQSSQYRKRPASEHAISNSPKKPRDETDDEDFMQYLNFSQSQAQKWKTSVWCVVGWISIFSKVRNPSTVTNGLCSTIQHVQI